MFHAVLLKPYQENKVYGEKLATPPPDIVNGEEVYQVETILKHRRGGWEYQYLIKWEGYPITEASWKPESAFSDDGDLLDEYKQQHQLWKSHT